MLNYNKIHSAINFDRTSKTKLAEYIGIAHTTLRSRLDRENLTPEDIEKIAEFFDKPIAYFFDKDGKEPIGLEQTPGRVSRLCKECVEKQKEIDQLKQKLIEAQEKLNITQEKIISLIEAHDQGKSSKDFQKKNCG